MAEETVAFLDVGDGSARRRIAYIAQPPVTPRGIGLVWLCGLKSDMASTKAIALRDWAAAHGRSSGRFEDATVGDWLEETRAVFTRVTSGPQILVGSSTGGHIALLLV